MHRKRGLDGSSSIFWRSRTTCWSTVRVVTSHSMPHTSSRRSARERPLPPLSARQRSSAASLGVSGNSVSPFHPGHAVKVDPDIPEGEMSGIPAAGRPGQRTPAQGGANPWPPFPSMPNGFTM